MIPSLRYHASQQHEPRWRRYLVGNGTIEQRDTTLRLMTKETNHQHYSDSQIDDFRVDPAQPFVWYPPLRMTICARFSHPAGVLQGTAGFGFWNYPFLLPVGRLPTLPRVVWFFYASPPSNMKLDMDTPGWGWKAATMDAWQSRALLLAPLAPIAVPLMNIPVCYRWLWSRLQPTLGIRESLIPVDMTAWHVYTIDWGTATVSFRVDGNVVLANAPAPQGPLCFVMWIDNQYLAITPWGSFRWGLLDSVQQQWVEIEWLHIAPNERAKRTKRTKRTKR